MPRYNCAIMGDRSIHLVWFITVILCVSSVHSSDNCRNQLDVIAVLDGSGSIPSADFTKLKNAVIHLVNGLNVGPKHQRFGTIVFSSTVSKRISLSSSVYSLRREISRIRQPGGGTGTDLGIQEMTSMFRRQSQPSQVRPKARKVGIVITDGRSNNEASTLRAASAARRAGVVMFAVGVGVDINKKELRAIASSSSYVMELKNFNALQSSIKALIKKICKVHGGWSSWSTSRSRCSKTCGRGTRTVTSTRTCTNPRPSNGGRNCAGPSTSRSTETCNTNACPVHGGWSSWSTSRGKCSVTCGRGTRTVTKTRTCTKPRPSNGGRNCLGSSTLRQKETCNTNKCQVDGGWSSWSSYSRGKCSVTCGKGTRTVTRTRTCTNPRPSNGGKNCAGSANWRSTETCNKNKCPVHGGWSKWSAPSRGKCSASCGGGTRTVTRARTCTNPPPSNGGKKCGGSAIKRNTEACNQKKCPVHGGWSKWVVGRKGKCSKTCGGGTRTVTMTRTCTKPRPSNGGNKCNGPKTRNQKEACNTHKCPVNGGWGRWEVIGETPCSATCGGGIRTVTKVRSCNKPRPSNGGKNCVGLAFERLEQACNTKRCAVNGGWSKWCVTKRGPCSKTCGGGTRPVTKTRTCTNPPPNYGGKNCVGKATERTTENCNARKCPVHGGWSKWKVTERSECTVTCGGGTRVIIRTRTCTNPRPGRGGKRCVGPMRKIFREACNAQKCKCKKE